MKPLIANTIRIHKQLVAQFEAESIDTVIACAEKIISSIRKGGTVYICGNGGSAADAQHIAGELLGRFKKDRKAFPAVALTTDTSVITAIANDHSFDDIFTRQVEALVRENDVLWLLSTSGKSPNILAAATVAKIKKASVIAFTGKENTPLERTADLCLLVDAPDAASAQQIHQLAYHIICDLVETALCEESPGQKPADKLRGNDK